MSTLNRHLAIGLLVALCIALSRARADQIVCTADGQGNDGCDITFPNVLANSTTYPNLSFQPGDTVVVSEVHGCVQTGGSGDTWKRYLDPSGKDSDHLYRGQISIPGVTNGLVTLSSVVGNAALPPSSGGPLVLGYQDDDYHDNGYWSHDDGNDDQCADQGPPNRGRAFIHLDIHRAGPGLSPAGTVYGQCAKIDSTHETCQVDRPDVTTPTEVFPSIQFCPGDSVQVIAQGCVQTGGSGSTWKQYVSPSGSNSDHLYHGLIDIPGVTNGMVRLSTVVGSTSLPASPGGLLSLGYEDDDYGDNGYWSHDDGTDNQCENVGPASVTLNITHPSASPSGCGFVYPVTGTTPETAVTVQSETAATVVNYSGGRRIVVAFNDQTNHGDTIRYTPTSRSVVAGASLMGWAYSDDDGRHWTYGGKVQPNADWPIIWGDPAIAAIPDSSMPVVFLSNLAIPAALVSPGGPVATTGGACLAKSIDGGVTFALYQCVSNTDPPGRASGHFYDGASLAATSSGAVFAAYEDLDTGRIDVWSAPAENAPFARIAEPFPNMQPLTHPRLRASADGSVYAGSVFSGTAMPGGTSGQFVFINRYINGAWGVPQRASDDQIPFGVPVIDLHSPVLGNPLTIRMAAQFAFDVGTPSAGGQDAVRVMATRRDGVTGNFYVEGSACSADLSRCHPVPEWSVGPLIKRRIPLQAFDPVVAAIPSRTIGRPPKLRRTPAAWVSAYYVVEGSQTPTIQTAHMYLNYMNGLPVGSSVTAPDHLTVCSDTRGYWGDYNEIVGLPSLFGPSAFVSFISRDQQLGCVHRWMFDGRHQHVAAVRWDP